MTFSSFNTTSCNTLQLVDNNTLYKSAIYARIDEHIDHAALSAIKLKRIIQLYIVIVYHEQYVTKLM